MTGLASVAANTHVQTLEVLEVIAETADAVSVVLAVPDSWSTNSAIYPASS